MWWTCRDSHPSPKKRNDRYPTWPVLLVTTTTFQANVVEVLSCVSIVLLDILEQSCLIINTP